MMTSLKTKRDELVLEKFFNEYITVWYQGHTVDANTWDKARNEIELLKRKKSRTNKQIIGSSQGTDDNVQVVKSLINDMPVANDAKKNYKEAKAPPGISKDSPKEPQPINKDRNLESKQRYSKEQIELQLALQENFALSTKVTSLKEQRSQIRAETYIELKDKEDQIERLKKALENSKAQIDDLTLRLSKLAGDKLRQGNPDLADLSDPNRPTELGKRFSEIYDNEWSDAFENIPLKEEDKKVGLLHGIVTKSFTFCEQKFGDQTAEIQALLLGLTGTASSDGDQVAIAGNKKTKIHNFLTEIRKELAGETAGSVANEFLSATLEQFVSGFGMDRKMISDALRNYARVCAELCWYMVVCDPRMAISKDKDGITFDTNVYKPYTKSVRDLKNPVVALRVWPALHLYERGPLVAKGVAQPGEAKKKIETSVTG